MNIVTTEGKVAFTPENLPGTGQEAATPEQMAAHAKRMNGRAQTLGLKTRYEVQPAE